MKNIKLKWYTQWSVLRWILSAIAGAAIWGTGMVWEHYYELDAPARAMAAIEAQAKFDKMYPRCPQIIKSEVKNADGSVTTREARREVYCDKTPPPAAIPTWLKTTLIIFGGAFVLLIIVAIIANPRILLSL